MASLSPEEKAEKAQSDFVRSAVRDVRYGPESLSEFTQWRVCPHPLCWESVLPGPCRLPWPKLPWRSLAMKGCGRRGGQGRKVERQSCWLERPFPNLESTSSL